MIDATKLKQYAARLEWEEASNARSIAYELLTEVKRLQAALDDAVKAEREACAKVCRDWYEDEALTDVARHVGLLLSNQIYLRDREPAKWEDESE